MFFFKNPKWSVFLQHLRGETGPSATFADIPDGAKWLMSIGMLLGRLELFTVIVLFTRAFWRN